MRKLSCLLLGVVFLCGHALAQNRTVSGRVTDNKGNPLPNVSVVVKGTDVRATTGANGEYQLSLPANAAVLEFSSGDLLLQEASISARDVYDIRLGAAVTRNLDEVVVIGYGVKSAREITGAVSKVTGSRVAEMPLPSFDQALAGKTAGVQVNATGGVLGDEVAIRIRGINSVTSSSQPLVVIDGVPQLTVNNVNTYNGGNNLRFNPLTLVNPGDIESIEVLKDAAAGAIYGSRASNGVILITTKSGKKGTARVNAHVKLGWSRANRLPQMLNGDEFIRIQNEKSQARFGADIARESNLNGDTTNDRTDWIDLLYRTAMTKDYNVNMSGGSEKVAYFGSVRYLDQEGISYKNRLRTGQGRLNVEMTPKTWFRSGMELSYSRTLNNGIYSDRASAGSGVGWQAFPTLSPFNPAGPRGYNLTTTAPVGIMGWGNNTRVLSGNTLINAYNPVAAVDLSRQNNTAEDLKGLVFGEVQPVKGLKLTSRFGVQSLKNLEDQYTSPYIAGLGSPYNGLVTNQNQEWRLWNWQNYLSFDKTFATDHKVQLTAGSEYQKNEYFMLYTGGANFSDPFFQYVIDGAYTNVQPGTTTTLNLTGGDKRSSGLESYFGRFGYTFKNKYFLEGSFRGDAYSGFGISNKWGYFPGLSAGWEVTREDFLSGVEFLDYLKLRASYGRTGNMRGVSEYASRGLYGGGVYTTTTGLAGSQAGNAGLKWERATKMNVGLDAWFLHNRLGLVVDVFKNNVDDLILDAPVLYTVGVPNSRITSNVGSMYNKGIEATVNATPVVAGDFRWTTSLNYTRVANEVTGLVPASNNTDITSAGALAPAINRASLNKPLGVYYLPRWAGVDPGSGNPMWLAADGTFKRYNFGAAAATLWTDEHGAPVRALSADDYVYLDKSGLPKWYGGWDNTFSYKSVDLSVFLIFQGGNYLYNQTLATLLSNSFLNNDRQVLDRWQKPGDATGVPRLYLLDNTANGVSTRFLEKGDFMRVRTVSLGYNAGKKLLGRAGFESARIYLQAFNAFTFTKYKGIDPEVNSNRQDNIAVGYDLRNVPQPKTISVGIQAGF